MNFPLKLKNLVKIKITLKQNFYQVIFEAEGEAELTKD
jgi:hypothetical protein